VPCEVDIPPDVQAWIDRYMAETRAADDEASSSPQEDDGRQEGANVQAAHGKRNSRNRPGAKADDP
jgi:hypothetical protein